MTEEVKEIQEDQQIAVRRPGRAKNICLEKRQGLIAL
jgi:hypothetical protein